MKVKKSTYYEVLGVSPQASANEIRRVFRELALRFHPDHNSNPEANEVFSRIHKAYQVLTNRDARARYDLALARLRWGRGPHFARRRTSGRGSSASRQLRESGVMPPGGHLRAISQKTIRTKRGDDAAISISKHAATNKSREKRPTGFQRFFLSILILGMSFALSLVVLKVLLPE